MAKAKQNKAEQTAEQVARLLGVGKPVSLETVDFTDPNRPKTCLEVDFPILPINQIAAIEGNAGKPIYQMSKWWARRRSSVFRSMLIAAATKAPEDESLAAKTVWDAYYANHQKGGSFKGVNVAEIFMGGGTTVVEGARLGMNLTGNDLNPVAWFVVKSEFARPNGVDVQRLLDEIDAAVRPAIIPYNALSCPRGHKGGWKRISDGCAMPADFDPLALPVGERGGYDYEGPEALHTFWAKHGPCEAPGCGHRTPILTTPVVAVKTLSVKTWIDHQCGCGKSFDIEHRDARMAPAATFVVAPSEKAYATMDEDGGFKCPHCGRRSVDSKARMVGESVSLGKSKNKPVSLSLLVHPKWMKGSAGTDADGLPLGGSATDDARATARWHAIRRSTLELIEVRGELPASVTCPDGTIVETDVGTVPKKSTFTCQEATCGREQDVLESIKATGRTGAVAPYAVQGYCPDCDREGVPYGGRFFDLPDSRAYDLANEEWEARRGGDLAGWWPASELPYGFMTHHLQGGVPNHGFTHWWTMFNARQLLTLSQMLKALVGAGDFPWETREFVLGVFQQYLRNQNMFCFWHKSHDHFAPHLSNNNFHPKSTVVEIGGTIHLGYGPWKTTAKALFDALAWTEDPWETASKEHVSSLSSDLGKMISGKSEKVRPGDRLPAGADIRCGSSTDLSFMASGSQDLVITDPPFGGLLHYSELSDFFYVWLRLALKERYPEYFEPEYTPKSLEAVANRARQPEDPDAFYQRLLTACWREAHRILKPGGLLAFTFHHSGNR